MHLTITLEPGANVPAVLAAVAMLRGVHSVRAEGSGLGAQADGKPGEVSFSLEVGDNPDLTWRGQPGLKNEAGEVLLSLGRQPATLLALLLALARSRAGLDGKGRVENHASLRRLLEQGAPRVWTGAHRTAHVSAYSRLKKKLAKTPWALYERAEGVYGLADPTAALRALRGDS